PERAERRKRHRTERVARAELPHPRQQLRDTAIRQRQTQHNARTLLADQIGIDHAEHERRTGKTRQPERPRIGRRPEPGRAAASRIRRGCYISLAWETSSRNASSFHFFTSYSRG